MIDDVYNDYKKDHADKRQSYLEPVLNTRKGSITTLDSQQNSPPIKSLNSANSTIRSSGRRMSSRDEMGTPISAVNREFKSGDDISVEEETVSSWSSGLMNRLKSMKSKTSVSQNVADITPVSAVPPSVIDGKGLSKSFNEIGEVPKKKMFGGKRPMSIVSVNSNGSKEGIEWQCDN